MEKQLAEVVDGTEIKEITKTQNLCSCENDGASNMVSSENDHTCGDCLLSTKGEYVEILEFTHFARVFKFTGKSNFGRKKEISNEITVSVVIELV